MDREDPLAAIAGHCPCSLAPTPPKIKAQPVTTSPLLAVAAGSVWALRRWRPTPDRNMAGKRCNAPDVNQMPDNADPPRASIRSTALAANAGIPFMTVRVAVSWQ